MRPNLINRLKEEWNNLDPVDPLRGLLSDAIDALAEQPAPPPECQTEAEKTAFAFGWFKALETVREQPAQQEPVKWSSYEPDGTHHNKPAQSKQKPVAWLKVIETPGGWGKFVEAKPHEKGANPVYTSPPASKPLTRKQLADAWIGTAHITHATERQIAYARAVEAAHGIKGDA